MTRSTLLIIVALLLCAQHARAIPAFARKYDMSCNVCHAPVPSLKPFGNEFAANGYQLQDQEPPRFTRVTGDDHLLLMRELPLAIRFDGYARYQPGNMPETDMQWAYILKILSSGQIARDVSYFLYFLFNERGEVAGVEDAFLAFNNIGGIPLDATIGQYQVADPIFKRELRPTFEDYAIYTIRPGKTKADLAYDRGVTLSYSLPTGTDLLLSVLNGDGIRAADASRNFDSDPYKNFFFRVGQQMDSTIACGVLGYIGKERDADQINDFTMLGADAKVSMGPFEFGMQYLYRNDKNPQFLVGGASTVISRGGFAQLVFAPDRDRSDWYITLLYNNIGSDAKELTTHSMTGNFAYVLARNFKLMGEYTYDMHRERSRVAVGFVTAF